MTAVSTEWVEGLVQDRAQESTHLDFKREQPSKKEDGRRELLKDVCAFANTEGGRIIYGVDEDDERCASRIVPITDEAVDAAQRRLDQAIADGIHPRLVGHSVTALTVDGGYILVIDVPPQYGGPFQSHFNNQRRFTYRQGTINMEMDYNQLRSAFQLRGRALQEATSWRRVRLAHINDAIHKKRMVEKAWLVVHIIPFSALFDGDLIDLHAIATANRSVMNDHADSRTFTADGLLYQDAQPGQRPLEFVRFFRSGMVEFGWVGNKYNAVGELLILGFDAASTIRDLVSRCAQILVDAGVVGPAYVSLSGLLIESHRLHYDGPHFQLHTPEPWESEMEPPMLEVSSLSELASAPDTWCRPLSDMLFQTFGLDRCVYYGSDGAWKPPRR
ncbi:ATP-binding protein [Stenotrophomonas rhizophila]|uniref:AlbA family DNA-binding domain-containing protein n=1 Tax=Stenotrophomonas rhizophila TaxID=216778 RepID=UPI00201CC85C|nr:ATP-binding protein [Stenotrophomonas rhizophila]UQY87985.1 ATP-binding protein [Stenotrophomonas rhizophila]